MADPTKRLEHWRARAAEARQIASRMQDEISKSTMIGIAEDFERLVRRAELKVKKTPKDAPV